LTARRAAGRTPGGSLIFSSDKAHMHSFVGESVPMAGPWKHGLTWVSHWGCILGLLDRGRHIVNWTYRGNLQVASSGEEKRLVQRE
jgi:hypothetical protein